MNENVVSKNAETTVAGQNNAVQFSMEKIVSKSCNVEKKTRTKQCNFVAIIAMICFS